MMNAGVGVRRFIMKTLSRRDLMRLGMHASAALAAPAVLTGCPASPPFSPATYRSLVAAITGLDLAQMARDAIDACGGIERIVNPGETVFIKANFCAAGLVRHNSVTSGDSTKPEIVLAVAEECLKAGASLVTIGDAAQVPVYSWQELQTLDGAANMRDEAARLNALYGNRLRLACLNSESPAWRCVPSCTRLGHIKVSSLVVDADRVISLPVLKTHRWTQITASMKNFVGVTSVNHYGLGGPWRFQLHNAGIEQAFLDIVNAVRPDFTIIDCSVGCEGNGPHVLPGYWGTTVDMRERLGTWVLLASTDLAAADATAARLIGQDVAHTRQLQMAFSQGIGQIHKQMIDLAGARLDDIRVEWLAAEPTDGFWDILIPGIHMLLEG